MSSSDATDEFKDDFDLSDLGLATREKPTESSHTGDQAHRQNADSAVPEDSDEEILDLALVGEFLGVASDPFSEQAKAPNTTELDPFAQKDASLVHLNPTDFVPEEQDASDAEMVEDSANQKADALLFDFENVNLNADDTDLEIFKKESEIFRDEGSPFSTSGDGDSDSQSHLPPFPGKDKKRNRPPKTDEAQAQETKENFLTLEEDLDDALDFLNEDEDMAPPVKKAPEKEMDFGSALDFLDEDEDPGSPEKTPARREMNLEDSLNFLDEDKDLAPSAKKAPEEEMDLGGAFDFLDEDEDPAPPAKKAPEEEMDLGGAFDFLDEDEDPAPPEKKPANQEVNLEDALDFMDEEEEFPKSGASSPAPQPTAPEKKSSPEPQKETGGFYPVSDEEDILDIDDILAAPVLPQGFRELSGEADIFHGDAKSSESFSDAEILDIEDLLLKSDSEEEALPQFGADTKTFEKGGAGPGPAEWSDTVKSESPGSVHEDPDEEEIELGDLFADEVMDKTSSASDDKPQAQAPQPSAQPPQPSAQPPQSSVQPPQPPAQPAKSDEEISIDDIFFEELPADEEDFLIPDADNGAFDLGVLDDEELGTLIIGDVESPALAEDIFDDGAFDLDDAGLMKFSIDEASLPDIKPAKETPREKTEETIQVQDFDSSLDTALDFLFGGEEALSKTEIFPEDGEKPSEPADDAALQTSPADSELSSLDGLEDEDFLTDLDDSIEKSSLDSMPEAPAPSLADIGDEEDLSGIFDEESPKTPEQKTEPKLAKASSDFGLFSSDDSALGFLSEGDGALAEDDLIASEEYLADIGEDSPASSREGLPVDRGFGKQQTAEKTQEESGAETQDLFGEDTFSAEEEAQADEEFDALFKDLEDTEPKEETLKDPEIEMPLEEGSPEKELSLEDTLLDELDVAFDEDAASDDKLEMESLDSLPEEDLASEEDLFLKELEELEEKGPSGEAETGSEEDFPGFEDELGLELEKTSPEEDLLAEDEDASDEAKAEAEEDFSGLEDELGLELEKTSPEEDLLAEDEDASDEAKAEAEEDVSGFEDELGLELEKTSPEEDLLTEEEDASDEAKTEAEEDFSGFEAELELEKTSSEEEFPAEDKTLAETEMDPDSELEPKLEMDLEDSFLKESGGISAEEARLLAEEAEKLSEVLEGYPDDEVLAKANAQDFSDLDILFDGKPALELADENIADVVSQVKGAEDFGKVISQVLTPGEARVPSAVERDIVLAVNPPISVSELESMLEKIVRKVLSEKIDAALVAAVEKAVEKEFKALAHSLYDEE